jgi:hypothetical protein
MKREEGSSAGLAESKREREAELEERERENGIKEEGGPSNSNKLGPTKN